MKGLLVLHRDMADHRLAIESLRERMGDYPTALSDLEQYVQYRSGARDIQTVTETVRLLRRHTSASGDS